MLPDPRSVPRGVPEVSQPLSPKIIRGTLGTAGTPADLRVSQDSQRCPRIPTNQSHSTPYVVGVLGMWAARATADTVTRTGR